MKTIGVLLAGVLLSTIQVQAHMSKDQVKKQFHEPGHIPQGLKWKMYHPLNEVIPKAAQAKIHANKLKKKKIKFKANNDRPQEMDLRKYDSPIRIQWDGTCTAHGLIAAVENLNNREKINPMLSARYFWNQYQKYDCYTAIDAVRKNKQILDKYWPENSKRPVASNLSTLGTVQVAETTYLDDEMDDVIDALAEQKPVYVGMSVPSDMASCRSTIRPTTDVTDGGHALAVVGYTLDSDPSLGGGYLILKNSWGTDCADNGYQYLPMSLCKREDMYCVFWSIDALK